MKYIKNPCAGLWMPLEIYSCEELNAEQKIILSFLFNMDRSVTIKEISEALKINKQRVAKQCKYMDKNQFPVIRTKIITKDCRILVAYFYGSRDFL